MSNHLKKILLIPAVNMFVFCMPACAIDPAEESEYTVAASDSKIAPEPTPGPEIDIASSTEQADDMSTSAPSAVADDAAIASTSTASVSTTFCNNHAYTYVVKKYSRGSARLPLRCGLSTWGFRHLTHRWNSAFDSAIALTISRGENVADFQQDGGSRIYALFDNHCTELFRVIYNGGAYRGNDVRPQGIISAYRNIITAAVDRSATSDETGAPSYRTDCPVYQNI